MLFFAPQLGGGGAEKHLVRVASHLDTARFTPLIAVTRSGGTFEAELPDHVRIADLGCGDIRHAFAPLRALVRRERPDVVCSFMDRSNCVAIAASRTVRGAPPVVAGIQTPPSIVKGMTPAARQAVFRLTLNALYPFAHIVALSSGVAEDVSTFVPSIRRSVTVIPNAGVDDTVIALANRDIDVPADKRSGHIVVACGRLTEAKGFPYLLQAVATLRESVDVTLWLIGDGELRRELEQTARELRILDRVWFAGFQRNPYALMARGSVFVLSSLWEGFGNVVVEAMAVGTPVISTDCPFGPREIIPDERFGILVPPGDATALAAAIRSLLGDAQLRNRLSHNGRLRAQDFAACRIAYQYGEVFESLPRTTAHK